MSGKQSVINIGKKVIQLVRQDCMGKYGSAVNNQSQVRKLSEFDDQVRCYQARSKIQRYRQYLKSNFFNMSWIDHIKILKQISAGNCGQMAILTTIILMRIVPPGIKVQHRSYQKSENLAHQFVALVPQNAVNDDQTLIIDAWPSQQFISPQVCSYKDYFLYGEKYYLNDILDRFLQPKRARPLNRYLNFDHIQSHDFNLTQLSQIQEIIKSKQNFSNPYWQQCKRIPYDQFSYAQFMLFKKQHEKFLSRRRNTQFITKQQKN